MYDPIETDLSFEELTSIFRECAKKDVMICLIGGWATHLYVNEDYKRAFGQDYMGSRDIDIFFDPKKETEFSKIIFALGFEKNGFSFRYEKIYNRETGTYITPDQAKKEQIFDLLYIFLDLFSNKETKELGSWWDLKPLKDIFPFKIKDFVLADIDTLIALKCTAIFARDKSDKENKDACDLYALLQYSATKIKPTVLLQKAITKILSRPDLLYSISEHVLLDPGRQSIVKYTLENKLKEMQNIAQQ